jgi:NADH dehydrogenase (ubiquinone) Fe-S protein 6
MCSRADAVSLIRSILFVQNQRTAQEYIDDVPVVEVDGPTAICDGGDPRLGHPIQFIQLNTVRQGKPATCKYCGLRFIQAHHH